MIKTLPAGRSSDVLLWDTSSIPEGTYNIYTVTGLNTSMSEAPIVVSHSRAQDTSLPVLHIDVPVNGYRFRDTLQVSGYSLDNVRIAIIEVHMDGRLLDSFKPDSFDSRARDAYRQSPYASSSGFNRLIDTSTENFGSHNLTVTAYDTAGNSTMHSAMLTKALDNLTATFSPPFQEASPIALSEGLQPKDGGGGKGRAKLGLKISKNKLTVTAFGGKLCASMRLFASISAKTQNTLSASGILLQSISGRSLKGVATKIPRLSKKGKIYFLADCGAGSKGAVKSINARNFSGKRVKSLKKVFDVLVENYRPS
ncbi:MAG: hypothetical protein GYA55_00910 [SAR324 cluster bacterium]|uniref:Uncharacterized protein n=1 Tax=SAR324 cluster bacterium TaxID=2024889 RepID=A0A7X9IIK8_9DELT|nr:hypothetical protein [SAR324 cluster bacterium]